MSYDEGWLALTQLGFSPESHHIFLLVLSHDLPGVWNEPVLGIPLKEPIGHGWFCLEVQLIPCLSNQPQAWQVRAQPAWVAVLGARCKLRALVEWFPVVRLLFGFGTPSPLFLCEVFLLVSLFESTQMVVFLSPEKWIPSRKADPAVVGSKVALVFVSFSVCRGG